MNSFIGKTGFLSYFVLVTISQVVTTSESYIAISGLKLGLVILLITGHLLSFRKINVGLSLLFYFVVVYVISILSYDNILTYSKDFLIILIGLPFVSFYIKYYDVDKELLFISFCNYYFYFLLILTLFCGGFNFDGFMTYNLSYSTELIGSKEVYSLGLSNSYGLLTVIFLYHYLKINTNNLRYFLSFFLSFFMTLLGGARGEIIICLFLVFILSFLISSNKNKKIFLYLILVVLISILIIYIGFDRLSELFTFFGRMEVLLDGNMSNRDSLIIDSLLLLENNPSCLIFGCGPGYFQYYYQYPFSFFPHNSVIEFLISYGAISLMIFALFILKGFFKHKKLFGSFSLIFFIFSHQFLISLKSGYLMGSYLMFVLAIVLFSLGFYRNAVNS